ncbi:hypothetical protein HK405_010594 [Cladochytrium tenue]|nr:hypothetical protein HK405_010594 [Cladochytrium tenue]
MHRFIQATELEERLNGLRGGVQVSAADQERVDRLYQRNMKEWRSRKKLFRNIWDTIAENVDKPKELMESLGIETDEMVGVDINKCKA